jgi:hypothetical protein
MHKKYSLVVELFKVLESNPEIICDVANFLLVALEKRSRNS